MINLDPTTMIVKVIVVIQLIVTMVVGAISQIEINNINTTDMEFQLDQCLGKTIQTMKHQ